MSALSRMHIFFFLSGASALVYEIVWVRRLSLTLGHTILAISAVVTIFMLGLAIGGFYGGRWADRRSSTELLRDYARLELLIAVWGALSLLLLTLFEKGYLALAGRGLEGLPLYLAGFCGAMVVLLLPTIAMGATLPLLGRLVIGGLHDLGANLARLYGVNTLGAFFGSAAAGFFLLPWLGLSATTGVAAVTNLLIAALAYHTEAPEVSVPPIDQDRQMPGSPAKGYLIVAFFAAAAAMSCQVGWTRGVVLSLGSSTYAFAAILALFLIGLGLGSLCYRLVIRKPGARQMGWLQFAIGASVALTVAFLGHLPYLIVRLSSYAHDSFVSIMLIRLVPVALVLLLPTFLMGIVYPLATHLYIGGPDRVGRTVGTVYAATTLGSIVGAFGAGFVGIPLLGAQGVLKLAVLISLALAFGCFLARRDPGRALLGPALAVLAAGVCLALPRWNPAVMSAGTGLYTGSGRLNLTSGGEFIPPGFYRDGISATVAVHVGPDWQTVRVNGKIDASLLVFDRLTMYLTGYLPGLLHGEPRSAAVVGFGAGMTVESLSHFPSMQNIDCVELEPAMLEAGYYWKGYNGDILAHPKVNVTVNDGRTFILSSPDRYDLIVSEPSNPWIAGVASLFTADFYQHCQERLNEGGIVCQWFHLYGISEESVALVVRTFFSVFPEGAVWRSARGDILLLGSMRPLSPDIDRIRERWDSAPDLRRTMLQLNLYSPDCLLGHFWLTRADALRFAGPGPLNTDDRPLLEYWAPLTLFKENTVQAVQEALEEHRSRLLPVPENPTRLAAAGIGWLNTRRPDLVREHLTLESAPLAWARMLEADEERGAESSYRRAASSWIGSYWLAKHLAGKRRYREALPYYADSLTAIPEPLRVNVLLDQADCALAAQEFELALNSTTQALRQGATDSRVPLLRGRALYAMGQLEDALQQFEVGSRLNPSGLGLHMGRAHTLLRLGKDPEPVYREILDLSPGYLRPMIELARYQAARGRKEDALATVARAYRYFPKDHVLERLERQIRFDRLNLEDVLK